MKHCTASGVVLLYYEYNYSLRSSSGDRHSHGAIHRIARSIRWRLKRFRVWFEGDIRVRAAWFAPGRHPGMIRIPFDHGLLHPPRLYHTDDIGRTFGVGEGWVILVHLRNYEFEVETLQ